MDTKKRDETEKFLSLTNLFYSFQSVELDLPGKERQEYRYIYIDHLARNGLSPVVDLEEMHGELDEFQLSVFSSIVKYESQTYCLVFDKDMKLAFIFNGQFAHIDKNLNRIVTPRLDILAKKMINDIKTKLHDAEKELSKIKSDK